MSHVSFSAASGRHVHVGNSAGAVIDGAGEPHHWWRALWSRRDGRVAEIRRLMRAQITAMPNSQVHAALAAQIVQAEQPEALWALRHALTQVLVEVHGEALARQRMTDISFMFAGLLDRERHARANADGTDWASGKAVRGLARSAGQVRSDH